jgi:GNAT superfamily N-acetyltransferase
MTPLSVGPFHADAAELVTSWATTPEEVAAWCSRTEAPVPPELVVGWSRKDGVRAYLLHEAGQPVAYGELWIDDNENEVELAHIVVDPRRRGGGLGRALTTYLADAGRQFHETVFLRFVPGNAAAQACSAAARFVPVTADQEREWNEGQPQPYRWMTYAGPRRGAAESAGV